MAQVASYDPASLPVTPTVPPKHSAEEIAQYLKVMKAGKAAGDGTEYPTKKAAQGAANSVKRAIRKQTEGISTQARVWNNGTEQEPAWFFALTLRA